MDSLISLSGVGNNLALGATLLLLTIAILALCGWVSTLSKKINGVITDVERIDVILEEDDDPMKGINRK